MTEAEPAPGQRAGDCLIVGAGLIGTSIGLALRAAGRPVWLEDADPEMAAAAAAIGAGAVWPGAEAGAPPQIGLVVVAVEPMALAQVVAE
ncbi:MAG: prephenate dehydrogenase, partial [Propionibacteriaceae bacterium]|nr:prephenate dehydrogenase [Propionibacteriaceae bacterium]